MNEYQWKDVSVVGFDELMQALDRADCKGYMPDAIKEDWEAFNWKPAQPQQEPVAWATQMGEYAHIRWSAKRPEYPMVYEVPLYTSPPAQRTWVGLTDEEIDQGLLRSDYAFKTAEAWRAGVVFAMTKLKEKNSD